MIQVKVVLSNSMWMKVSAMLIDLVDKKVNILFYVHKTGNQKKTETSYFWKKWVQYIVQRTSLLCKGSVFEGCYGRASVKWYQMSTWHNCVRDSPKLEKLPTRQGCQNTGLWVALRDKTDLQRKTSHNWHMTLCWQWKKQKKPAYDVHLSDNQLLPQPLFTQSQAVSSQYIHKI